MASRTEDLTPPFFEVDLEVIGADTKHVYLLAVGFTFARDDVGCKTVRGTVRKIRRWIEGGVFVRCEEPLIGIIRRLGPVSREAHEQEFARRIQHDLARLAAGRAREAVLARRRTLVRVE
jgi:hypothetical protein